MLQGHLAPLSKYFLVKYLGRIMSIHLTRQDAHRARAAAVLEQRLSDVTSPEYVDVRAFKIVRVWTGRSTKAERDFEKGYVKEHPVKLAVD